MYNFWSYVANKQTESLAKTQSLSRGNENNFFFFCKYKFVLNHFWGWAGLGLSWTQATGSRKTKDWEPLIYETRL